MRRWILLLACLLALCLPAAAATAENMTIDCVVDENGTTRVSVDAQLHTEGDCQSLEIGLGPNVSGVQVEGWRSRTRRSGGETTLVLTSDAALPETMQLHFGYTVRNTVRAGDETQEFAIRLLDGMEAELKDCTITVTMPREFEAQPSFVSGYYADGIDNYMEITVREGVLTAVLTRSLHAGETLDLSIPMEPDYFTLHNVAGRALTTARVLMLVLLALGLLYWWRALRCPLPRSAVNPHPPAVVGPGEAGTLLTGETPDLALMITSWAVSGYVHITRTRRGQVLLERIMPMGNERNAYEVQLFHQLFDRDGVADERDLQALMPQTAAAVRKFWGKRLYARRRGHPRVLRVLGVLFGTACGLYFADSAIPTMSDRLVPLVAVCLACGLVCAVLQYGMLGILRRRKKRPIALLAVSLVLMVLAIRWGGHPGPLLLALLGQLTVSAATIFGPRRSENGIAIQSQLLGYRRYLGRLRPAEAAALTEQDPLWYYRNLPFALAMGVGPAFARAFYGQKLEPCSFYYSERKGTPQQAEEFYGSFCAALDLLRGELHRSLRQRQRRTARQAPHQTSRGTARPHRTRDYPPEDYQ